MLVSKTAKYLISHDCRSSTPEGIYNEMRELFSESDPDDSLEMIRILMTADKETLKLAANGIIQDNYCGRGK
ncbi:MAG: hypothetical protein SPL63_00170 [Roseburia faecis]|nr:hypothetical protein [Roseburia faecis]